MVRDRDVDCRVDQGRPARSYDDDADAAWDVPQDVLGLPGLFEGAFDE